MASGPGEKVSVELSGGTVVVVTHSVVVNVLAGNFADDGFDIGKFPRKFELLDLQVVAVDKRETAANLRTAWSSELNKFVAKRWE